MGFIKKAFERTPLDAQNELQKKEEEKKQKLELKQLRKEIELLKDNRFSKIKSTPKKEETTLAIQLLICHYLGFLEKIELKNTSKASLLAIIFNREGDENLRKALSNVGGRNSKYMTKSNLEYILKLFEKLNLTEILKKVQKDLQRIQAQ